jgi:PAS domain S-box-containing protein
MRSKPGGNKDEAQGAKRRAEGSGRRAVVTSEGSVKTAARGGAKLRKRVEVPEGGEASAEEFEAFFEHVSGVLFSIDIEPRGRFRFRSVNRAFLEVTGLKRDEVAGKLVSEVIPEPSCSMVLEKYGEAVRTGKTVRWEETSVYRTGARHGEVAVTATFDKRGKANRLLGIVHDITTRKAAEIALREAEGRFRLTLSHSPIVIFHQDRALKYTWIWNPHAAFNPDDVLGKTDADLVTLEEAARLSKLKRRVLRTGLAEREEVQLTHLGKVAFYDLSVEPQRDPSGKIKGIAGVAIDITARRKAEDALRRAESLLRGALDNAPFEFWVRDLEGVCLLQNQAVVRNWGDMLGKRPEEAGVAPGDLEIWRRNNRRAIAGEVIEEEVEFQQGGERKWMQSAVAPYRVDGAIEGILGFNIDITGRKLAEKALREGDARFARAVRGTTDGLWEWEISTGKTYLSPRWKELLGFADDELPSDRATAFYARLHPDDVAVVESASRENLAKFTPYAVEVRLLAKNGEYRWFDIRGQAEGDEEGTPVRVSGAMSDITERKQMVDTLREREQHLDAIFEQAAVGVGTIDIATGRFIEINGRYCAITGLTKHQMLAKEFGEITHPEDLRVSLEYYGRLRTGQISEFNLEKRYVQPDGKVVWANLSASLLRRPDGSPGMVLAIVEDISARKKAEENYLSQLAFNETLINNTSTIIVLFDPLGRMIYVNEAMLKLLGYRREELIDRTPREAGIMNAAETARTQDRLRRVLRGEKDPSREAILRGRSGALLHVELTCSSTRTANGVADRIIVTGTDLTERHHLQKEILRISEAEQADIGHNLHDGVGQTMTGLASLVELLEGDLVGEQKEQATRIRQLVQAAIQEVRQISHGMSPMAVKNRGLGGALQLLADTVQISHRVRCQLEVDAAIRIRDAEKETHIYRIAQEAVNNALRHGKPETIKLSLQRHGEDECVLKVEDNGTGITKKIRDGTVGIGVRVMDYRANFIGGTLEFVPGRKGGVSVICRFPCDSLPSRRPARQDK